MTHEALLEIGTEEIPAKLAPEIHHKLEKKTKEIMSEYRIPVEKTEVYGAPRRLAILLKGIGEYQKKKVEEIKGPPENIAYNDEGKPTKALEGFARNQNIEIDELEIRDTENGRYIFAVIEREKKKVIDLLSHVFPEIIKNLNFSKAMRWGTQKMAFIRPIHWICALYDKQTINFTITGVSAGHYSRGHRFLSPQKVEISSPAEYISILRKNYVLVDQEERLKVIKQGIQEIEEKKCVNVEMDSDLLKEVLHLVEYPTPFYGQFDKKYLSLPDPVLVTTTREHQRYFTLRGEDNNLKPGFIGVRDGSEEYLETVIQGNEKVLKARFDDAEFYFEKDLEISSQERIEKLKGLVFREELGTMYDKIERLEKFSRVIGQELGYTQENITKVCRTARLAKSDLVSHMVREFPELQGIMGRVYAQKEGEPEEICQAIEEHHRPEYTADKLPEGKIGQMLSLVDKLDTLCGCFAVGLEPTGSEDPYGLRRAAIGIIRLLEELQVNIPATELANKALGFYNNISLTDNKKSESVKSITSFLEDRLRYRLENKEEFRYDIIEAGLKGKSTGIPEIISRIKTLAQKSDDQEFDKLVTAFNRVESIARDSVNKNQINFDLFLEKEEENLYNIYWQVAESVNNMSEIDYNQLYQELIKLVEPIHNFFESVRVMSDDEKIKQNRLSLLSAILDKMLIMGDFSCIVNE